MKERLFLLACLIMGSFSAHATIVLDQAQTDDGGSRFMQEEPTRSMEACMAGLRRHFRSVATACCPKWN